MFMTNLIARLALKKDSEDDMTPTITSQPSGYFSRYRSLSLDVDTGLTREEQKEREEQLLDAGLTLPTLSYFTDLEELRIYRIKYIVTACQPGSAQYSYMITDKDLKEVFYAHEKPLYCNIPAAVFGINRGLKIRIQSNEQDVILIKRPFKWCAGSPCCCTGSCPYPAYIYDGNHTLYGSMMKILCCPLQIQLSDPEGKPLYHIRCPCNRCTGACCQIKNCSVTKVEDQDVQVANISLMWGRKYRKSPSFENCFKATFDRDLQREHKMLVFSAVFMLDTMVHNVG